MPTNDIIYSTGSFRLTRSLPAAQPRCPLAALSPHLRFIRVIVAQQLVVLLPARLLLPAALALGAVGLLDADGGGVGVGRQQAGRVGELCEQARRGAGAERLPPPGPAPRPRSPGRGFGPRRPSPGNWSPSAAAMQPPPSRLPARSRRSERLKGPRTPRPAGQWEAALLASPPPPLALRRRLAAQGGQSEAQRRFLFRLRPRC